ncbi:MAG: AAA family ATPase, partial [Clostridia bacterium]|nr:AAA family ATPase [Clostridia bacterium]
MGKYLNPKNTKFKNHLKNPCYVDKSGLIAFLNNRIENNDVGYYCVTRPRRFGKSYIADMLTAYYSRGCDSHTLFDGLVIARDDSYKTHLNRYNVIYFDVAQLVNKDVDADTGIVQLKTEIAEQVEEQFPDIVFKKKDSITMFEKIYDETESGFVFIIDEWDCLFREREEDLKSQELYIRFLRDILKNREYVALVYMTGILPIKKNWSDSDLNMFTEISMTNARPLQEYTGFTPEEVGALCTKFNRPFDEFKWWYDGYTVNGKHIYNPKSVVESLERGVSDNYWTSTRSFESLKDYIGENTFGIHDAIISMLAGGAVETDTTEFQNDMVNFKSLYDILTLLVHLGYLTYDFDSKTVSIPNHEIESEFRTIISGIGWESYISDYEEKKKVLDATLAGDEKTVAEIIARTHRAYSENYSNNEATLSAVLRESYAPALKNYSMVPEMPAGGGIADYILIPNKKIPDKPLIVLELKSKKHATAEGAIDQIKRNHYAEALSAYTGEILLVGI